MKRNTLFLLLIFIGYFAIACTQSAQLDQQLQTIIESENVNPIALDNPPDPDLVALGQALFFDKELSGNRDIACATCHHPTQGSGDGLAVSIGTGGAGLGPQRQIGYGRSFIPRNAPELYNRGQAEWVTMFWDSRIFAENDYFHTPAAENLPDGLDNVLAAQAMFPVTSNDEMRGMMGDSDVNGIENELAMHEEGNVVAIWDGLMARLLQYPAYEGLFAQAYPDVPADELGFQHAANAIAAFEIHAYTLTSSPWNNYLNGDLDALTAEQKEGAMLFFGDANCAACHSGTLLTDQQHHVLAVPQVGPGKGDEAPLDLGRWRETGNLNDMFAFRTPSLHNVATSAPYMHDGAFLTLESTILHHLDPEQSLRTYDPADHVIPGLVDTYQNDPTLIADMLAAVDPNLAPARELSRAEINSLIAFLNALTDPNIADLDQYVPIFVPSGLPVEELVEQEAN